MNKANERRRQEKALEFEKYVKSIEGYTLLSEYKTVNEPVKMKHNCGNEYLVRPSHFKTREQRCKKCSRKKDREEGKKRLLNELGNDYSLCSDYENNRTDVLIKHNLCGNEYSVKPYNFTNGKRCPQCKTSSHGERLIREFLSCNNIEFKEQVKFEECKNKKSLPFDFAIYENGNIMFLLEFQGIQHYKESSLFGKKSFIETQKNDKIKKDFCKENNISLLEIKYTQIKNIGQILEKELKIG